MLKSDTHCWPGNWEFMKRYRAVNDFSLNLSAKESTLYLQEYFSVVIDNKLL